MNIELTKDEAVAALKAFGEYRYVTRCCGGDIESKDFELSWEVMIRLEIALIHEIEKQGSTYDYGISVAMEAVGKGWKDASDRISVPYTIGKRKEAAQ